MLLCLFSTHLLVDTSRIRSSSLTPDDVLADVSSATIQMAELIPLVDPPLPPMYKVGATDAALSVLALAESRESLCDNVNTLGH
jgi:hypothetical protein